MKKINWKVLNAALWTEVVLSYILPFRAVNGFQYEAGFPIPFLSVYNTAIKGSPLMSMNLSFGGFLLNGAIIYCILLLAIKTYQKFKSEKAK